MPTPAPDIGETFQVLVEELAADPVLLDEARSRVGVPLRVTTDRPAGQSLLDDLRVRIVDLGPNLSDPITIASDLYALLEREAVRSLTDISRLAPLLAARRGAPGLVSCNLPSDHRKAPMSETTIHAERTLGTSTSISIRDHDVTVDRPEDKGGSNSGPMGGELLLAAAAGCFMSTLIAAATAREQEIGKVTCTVVGHLNGTPQHFDSIKMTVASDTADDETFQHLLTVAERGCIVANTLKSTTKLQISTTPEDE